MKFFLKKLLIILLVSVAFLERGKASDTIPFCPKIVNHLGLETGFDYMAPSVGDEIRPEIPPERKIKANTSLPLSFKYSFSFTDPRIRNFLPGGYQGIGTGVLNLGVFNKGGVKNASEYIGYPVLLYVFQGGPFKKFNDSFSLGYEWNFGASFGWKPYSSQNEDFVLTVGSRVNAYLHLSLKAQWQLDPNFMLYGAIGVSHFSNGNTSWPNPGINSLGVRVGMTYTINPAVKRFIYVTPDTTRQKKLQYDISLWGAARKRVYKGGETPVLLSGHFACAGISFSPMWNLNQWWRLGPSVDLQWDESSDKKRKYIEGTTTEDIRFSSPDFARQMSFGISAHGELKMPIFAVNIGVGYNLYAPGENRGLYQNITLKTYLCQVLFLNVGYQLRNFHQQSSLMLGIGVTI